MEFEKLKQQVIEKIDMTVEPSDGQLKEIIDQVIKEECDIRYLSLNNRWDLHSSLFNSIRGLGVIEELLRDQEVSEIMVNGQSSIFVERAGVIEEYHGGYDSEEQLYDVIQQIVAGTNRRVNETTPIVDTRLKDGSRVNVVLPPISLSGPVVTIRKFPKESITIEDLIKWNSISEECAVFLEKTVKAGYNIFVSGGTGSGKTTFLNVLSNFIPTDERVVTIEDSAELQLNNIRNLVRMETRVKNSEGENEVSIRTLIKTALRMRPDRIIVGEIRGPEALDMLQAMNTGHDGSMSTGHGNSPKEMLARIETMVLMGIEIPLAAIRAQIASSIDIMVHLGRLRDKSRKVLKVEEIVGLENNEIKLNPLFLYREMREQEGKVIGVLESTGNGLVNTEKLKSKGMSFEGS